MLLGFDFEGSDWADEFIMAPGDPTEVSSQVRHHMAGEFSYFLKYSKLVRFPNPLVAGSPQCNGSGNETAFKHDLKAPF